MSALEFGLFEVTAADALIALALDEDLDRAGDITTRAFLDPEERGTVQIVARQPGVLAGLPVAERVFQRLDEQVVFKTLVADGSTLQRGTVAAEITGPVTSLLLGERTALNFLTHLSGIATLTRRYVDAVAGTHAQIVDTRKTLPGWRRLEKYAVRAGGGANHRIGLFDAVLIKDNHLAAWLAADPQHTIAGAVAAARERAPDAVVIEIEVDSLTQFEDVLPARPDIVLLDNMSCEQMRAAVALRDVSAPQVQLEASGGVNLETVAAIAATGVERISVGALTHSAAALDLAFDWKG
jgi:nicotinate-nucleotide pyrophosphorylase (carboxylating)